MIGLIQMLREHGGDTQNPDLEIKRKIPEINDLHAET